uniref:Ig-like domain-containing protein n=1 Tax=Sciurus vulgaris TaxID=55149 RepID=A0A8D2D179_SCIVU
SITELHPQLFISVVKLEPPWIQVLKEDYVTLKCQGARNTEDHSTQWFHNRSLILTQTQPSYRFKAKNDDSGEYTCQMNQTSLSDPVHLDVHSGHAGYPCSYYVITMTIASHARWHLPVILTTLEAEAGGSQVEASLGNLARPYLKIKCKRTGDVAQW